VAALKGELARAVAALEGDLDKAAGQVALLPLNLASCLSTLPRPCSLLPLKLASCLLIPCPW